MSSFGLIRVIPGHEIGSDIPEKDIVEVVESQLTQHIRYHWEINRNAKLRIEESLLEDLRAKNGEYHPQKLTQIRLQGGSEIYMMITATKQRAASSWIKDIALPDDEKAWGIEPTPMPELPPWAEKAIQERMGEMEVDNQDFMKLREFMSIELREQAKYSAEQMELKIEDQLVEAKWGKVINALIDDFTTFSTCILKGPQMKKRKTLTWKPVFGSVKPSITEELRPEFTRVSPFDIYPSPEAEWIDDGNLIEHIRFPRGELYNMIGVPGYKDDQIRKVLKEYTEGLREWLWQDTERNENEMHHHWWRDGKNGLIDGLHYWGSVQGSKLKDWGLDIPDEMAEYQIDAILIGKYIIRCQINNDPLARRPYAKANYDPIPGAFWGNSIRYLMNDVQEFCNATARALVNNMGMASGPMVEINYERLSPLEDELDIYPWKVWQTKGSEVGGGPAIQFFQPESNASELMAVYEQFERRADDATSIPRYAHGNDKVGGAGSTASGLSMLMSSAAKGIKAAIGAFDYGCITPAIEQMYYYNMITSNDQSIKGDNKIIARGAKALLLRDMSRQRLTEFLQLTSNPIDMEIIGIEGRASMLRKVAKEFDLEGIVPTKAVIQQKMQQQAENPPPDPEQLRIEADIEIEGIKQQGEADRADIEFQFKKDVEEISLQKIAASKEEGLARIEATKAAALDKQRRDESMAIRLMDEETTRIKERAEANAEADIEKHGMTIELKEKELELKKEDNRAKEAIAKTQAEAKAAEPAPEPAKPVEAKPMELTVIIDNKSGKIKKTIKLKRDKKDQIDTIDVVETEA